MNNKRIPLEDEEVKYRKRSKAKGQSRSDHKHRYIPVLLHCVFLDPIKKEEREIVTVDEVCEVCGRVNRTLSDSRWYDQEYHFMDRFPYREKVLSERAKSLPNWYMDIRRDKVAHKRG